MFLRQTSTDYKKSLKRNDAMKLSLLKGSNLIIYILSQTFLTVNWRLWIISANDYTGVDTEKLVGCFKTRVFCFETFLKTIFNVSNINDSIHQLYLTLFNFIALQTYNTLPRKKQFFSYQKRVQCFINTWRI